jgi:tetratricopeptide (TPR) repeat protein
VFGRLAAGRPDHLRHRVNLSVAAAEYGDLLLLKRNDPAAAKAAYTQSVIHVRPVAQPPAAAAHLGTLALNYYRLATAVLRLGDPKDARRLYGLCLELREGQMREAERRQGGKPDRAALAGPVINLMLARVRCGQHAEAAAAADEIARLFPDDPRRQFSAACGFALAAAAAPAAGPLRASYLDRAIGCVGRAVDRGYRGEIGSLERDPDLDPVRADPRFAPLVERAKQPRPAAN